MARFLVDESLPRAVARSLQAAGEDATDARDIGLRGKLDEEVLERAVQEGRVLLSGDLDFANALRFPAGSHPGIVVLRVPDSWGSELRARRVTQALHEVEQDDLAGAIVIVEPDRVRVFKLRPAESGA